MIYHRSLILLAALVSTVYGHGALVAVEGANGVVGAGMGINPATPRDGSRRRPFQQDTSIIRDRDIERGRAGPCGRTLQGGSNDIAAGVEAAASAGMPSMAEDGTVSMTIHQVNGDGAGPYTCQISTDATGTNFVPMTVITNVPGDESRSDAEATPFPLVARAPAGTTCTGGPDGNACIVRCRNDARAGPFGGCAVVMNPEVANTATAEAPAEETAEASATAEAAQETAEVSATAEATQETAEANANANAEATAEANANAEATVESMGAEGTATAGMEEAGAETEAAAAETGAAERVATGAARGSAAQRVAAGANRGNRGNAANGAAQRAAAGANRGNAANAANAANTEAAEGDDEEEFDRRDDAFHDAIDEDFAIAEAEELEEELFKRFDSSVAEAISNLFAKRDYSRKRMATSRIVGVEKRGKWI